MAHLKTFKDLDRGNLINFFNQNIKKKNFLNIF